MAEKKPTVRIAQVKGRPLELRYRCPHTDKRVRVSSGTHDMTEAEDKRDKLQAELLLGLVVKRKRSTGGPGMPWEEFRERYRELQLSTLGEKTAVHAESRLDIAERILKPRTLGSVADSEALHELQQKLFAGAESRFDRPRSKFTVRAYMAAVLAALNWAEYMQWLPAVPKVKKVKTARLTHMKGRPITAEEFERMLDKTAEVVGDEAGDSWKYLLRGLWESGLRLGELMDVHWTDRECIVPDWESGALPVLAIPHEKQKNETEESIPLLPGFELLLQETPVAARTGWAFKPASLQEKAGREASGERLQTELVGKVIGRIGEKAGVVDQPPKVDKPAKFASAHDLRRSCAERLVADGVAERDVMAVMRHADANTTRRHYAPATVQRSAANIRSQLRKAGRPESVGG